MLTKEQSASLLSLIEAYATDSVNAELALQADEGAFDVAQAMLVVTRARLLRLLAELTAVPPESRRKEKP